MAGTGPTVADHYDAVCALFFGATPDGAQREITPTRATSPGHGIVVCRLFIHDRSAAFGELDGDNRGFSLDAAAPYRIAMAWDTDTAAVSYTISSSSVREYRVPMPQLHLHSWPLVTVEEVVVRPGEVVPARPIEADGPNHLTFLTAAPDHLRVEYSGLNSVLVCCAVNGTIEVTFTGDEVTVGLTGDDYPDFECIQYRRGELPRDLGHSVCALESGLASIPAVSHRHEVWVNGSER
jgi:hypothetical protein